MLFKENSPVVVVTGVSGFIGRAVAQHYRKQGWQVVGISPSALENGPLVDAYYSMRLPDPLFADLIVKHRPRALIHCAGRASVPLSMSDPASDYHSGPRVIFSILDTLRKSLPECRFLMLSSAAVYGNPVNMPVTETLEPAPLSPYGFHKWQSELLCLEFSRVFGLATASTRIFSAYGPGLRRQAVWDICRKAISGEKMVLQGTGTESRDFLHVSDVVRGLKIIMDHAPMEGECYNLGCGQETTIEQLVTMIMENLCCPNRVEFDGKVPSGNPLRWCADINRLNKLGFSPTVSLSVGIRVTTDWCKSELEVI